MASSQKVVVNKAKSVGILWEVCILRRRYYEPIRFTLLDFIDLYVCFAGG